MSGRGPLQHQKGIEDTVVSQSPKPGEGVDLNTGSYQVYLKPPTTRLQRHRPSQANPYRGETSPQIRTSN